MLSRQDLREISKARLKEAKTLYDKGLFDGARYLIGYALETGLKARICKILDTPYPERGELVKVYHTHKFDVLILLAGLEKKLDKQKYDNTDFASNSVTIALAPPPNVNAVIFPLSLIT